MMEHCTQRLQGGSVTDLRIARLAQRAWPSRRNLHDWQTSISIGSIIAGEKRMVEELSRS